jgi:hypothetical protein
LAAWFKKRKQDVTGVFTGVHRLVGFFKTAGPAELSESEMHLQEQAARNTAKSPDQTKRPGAPVGATGPWKVIGCQ